VTGKVSQDILALMLGHTATEAAAIYSEETARLSEHCQSQIELVESQPQLHSQDISMA
jgi:hypothetical protein